MAEYNIKASIRGNMAKSYRKDLFRRGLIPAVVYGRTMGSLPLEVAEKDVQNAVQAGKNTIINLSVPGNGGPYKVMVRDLQYDPLRRSVIHADFQQINLRNRIHIRVPVQLAGDVAGGMAQIALRELEVSCLPAKIPNQITVDVSGMKPGDILNVSGLAVPRGVDVLTDPDVTVVTVLAPREEPAEGAPGGEKPGETAVNNGRNPEDTARA